MCADRGWCCKADHEYGQMSVDFFAQMNGKLQVTPCLFRSCDYQNCFDGHFSNLSNGTSSFEDRST